MLLTGIISSLLLASVCGEGAEMARPLVLPMPLELPNRNDRANQCWLRVEDIELTETLAVYCTLAQTFLSFYIHDYNNRKMTEDAVDVSLWFEKPSEKKDDAYGPPSNENDIKDWRVTTFKDPTTGSRVYASKHADCRLLMYSREALSNYKVDCATILYFFNEHSGSARFKTPHVQIFLLVFLVFNVM